MGRYDFPGCQCVAGGGLRGGKSERDTWVAEEQGC